MKRITGSVLALLFLLLPLLAGAAQRTGSIAVNGDCVTLQVVPTSNGTVQISGTWTGTISATARVGSAAAVALPLTPLAGGAAVTSTTANGTWTWGQAFTVVSFCATAAVTGTAVVDILSSTSRGTPAVDLATIGAAPSTAPYVTTTVNSGLSAEVSLGALSTGVLYHTVSGAVSTPAAIACTSGLLQGGAPPTCTTTPSVTTITGTTSVVAGSGTTAGSATVAAIVLGTSSSWGLYRGGTYVGVVAGDGANMWEWDGTGSTNQALLPSSNLAFSSGTGVRGNSADISLKRLAANVLGLGTATAWNNVADLGNASNIVRSIFVGSLNVGTSSPTPITNVRVYAASLTPSQLAAAIGATEETFTVTGLTTADKVFVNAPAPTALCPPVGYRVSAADTLAITFVDLTIALCTPAAGTYNVVAVRS